MAQKSRNLTHQPGHTRAGARQQTLYLSSTKFLAALCNLVPPDSLAFWRHGVTEWGPDAKIGKIGHIGWPVRVAFRCDPVKPSLDSRALVSPLVPCIGVGLAVMLAACCSLRGWSRDEAENSKKDKPWQRGTHRKLHHSSQAGGANTKRTGDGPSLTCYKNRHSSLARSGAPWRYGILNLAYNNQNSETWPKRPTLMMPYLHGHDEQ